MNSVHFITLGCSKNDVDTSQMQSILESDIFKVTNDIKEADVIVINTCGFIESAKEESIDTIMEATTYKKDANCKKLLLAGCLAQRYSEELLQEIPEVDGIIGTGNIGNINSIIKEALKGNRISKIDNINDKYIEGLKKKNVNVTEYVKISEGCNNNCTYCIIPKLRGKNRSRSIEDIYDEIEYLVEKGMREVILIGQNTSDYGIDNYGEYKLAELVREISKIKDLKWIRLMYLYPDNFNDDLINEFKVNNKLLKYVDIPLQHISDNVLNSMNRKTNKKDILNLISTLRKEIPEIVIRTTFIVGFPGESKEDFEELKSFIKENKFDKLGVFTYSKEEDTIAYKMENQIDENTKNSRLNEIMQLQKDISEEKISSFENKNLEVLVEEKVDYYTYIGRSYMDAPEIDGVVYIKTDKENKLKIEDFVNVRIVDSLEYDLIGEMV